jgi:hypothetical protein
MLAWTAHGTWSTQYRCLPCTLCVKQSSGIVASPHHARTCPLNRQGTAAAAHLHACFSKGCSSTASCTPLQHLWGSKAHTCTHTHTCAHAYTRKHTHTHACACANTHRRTHIHTHAHAPTHRHTHAHTYTRTNTQAHKRAQTHTCARIHSHAHMHMHANVEHVMGLTNFSASLAMLPHLSCYVIYSSFNC